ncbi:uncharacterized protein LOC129597347 [Paramacrobiotus metropolitanus]|uniref:uncharacterized protein LOC129597347 n=1 Tax=Paramacrobiotus metropolitanus TaxID=2943436 RepID=UPI002445D8BA|nr:uncharacterized protein LOC129597347 [Paramacrobiotus metropolitanus]
MSRPSTKSLSKSPAMSGSLVDLLAKLDEHFGSSTYKPTSTNADIFAVLIPVVQKVAKDSLILSQRVSALEAENVKLKEELQTEREIRAGGDAELLQSDEALKGHIQQIDTDQKQDVGTLNENIESLKESHSQLTKTVKDLQAWNEAGSEKPDIIEIQDGGAPGHIRMYTQSAHIKRNNACPPHSRREFWSANRENVQADHVLIIRPTDVEEAGSYPTRKPDIRTEKCESGPREISDHDVSNSSGLRKR